MAERLTDTKINVKTKKERLCQKLCDMKSRCYNPQNKFYKDYGARGITVCDEWKDNKIGHENFYKWAINTGYEFGLSIDRIDNDGSYGPLNCRWANAKEQANNTRWCKNLEYNGKKNSLLEWTRILNTSYDHARRAVKDQKDFDVYVESVLNRQEVDRYRNLGSVEELARLKLECDRAWKEVFAQQAAFDELHDEMLKLKQRMLFQNIRNNEIKQEQEGEE